MLNGSQKSAYILFQITWCGFLFQVHLRIASPPVSHPCYMGINIPTKEELIANKLNEKQLARKVGADTLVHLNVNNLLHAVKRNIPKNGTSVGHCTACLTGQYPVELEW